MLLDWRTLIKRIQYQRSIADDSTSRSRLLPGASTETWLVTGEIARMGVGWMPRRTGPMKGAVQRRNAPGSGGHAKSRGCPNGAIRHAVRHDTLS